MVRTGPTSHTAFGVTAIANKGSNACTERIRCRRCGPASQQIRHPPPAVPHSFWPRHGRTLCSNRPNPRPALSGEPFSGQVPTADNQARCRVLIESRKKIDRRHPCNRRDTRRLKLPQPSERSFEKPPGARRKKSICASMILLRGLCVGRAHNDRCCPHGAGSQTVMGDPCLDGRRENWTGTNP